MALIAEVLDAEPRITHVIYDGAMHGTHRDRLQRDQGVTTIAPIAAKTEHASTGTRIEKSGYLRSITFDYGPGDAEEVEIWHVGGWLCRRIITDDGTIIDERLELLCPQWRRNDDGTHRPYVQYKVPCPRGTQDPQIIREGTYVNDEDRRRGFNRAELILLARPGSPEYLRHYSRRSDAETANYQSDEQLHRQRARSLGARRQHLDLWAHSLLQVAIAEHRYDDLDRHRTAA